MSEKIHNLSAYVVVEELDSKDDNKTYVTTICREWLIPKEKKFWWPTSRIYQRLLSAEKPNDNDYYKCSYVSILFSSNKHGVANAYVTERINSDIESRCNQVKQRQSKETTNKPLKTQQQINIPKSLKRKTHHKIKNSKRTKLLNQQKEANDIFKTLNQNDCDRSSTVHRDNFNSQNRQLKPNTDTLQLSLPCDQELKQNEEFHPFSQPNDNGNCSPTQNGEINNEDHDIFFNSIEKSHVAVNKQTASVDSVDTVSETNSTSTPNYIPEERRNSGSGLGFSNPIVEPTTTDNLPAILDKIIKENLKPLEEKITSLETINKTLCQEIQALNAHVANIPLRCPTRADNQPLVSIRGLYDFPLKYDDFETLNSSITIDEEESHLFNKYLEQIVTNTTLEDGETSMKITSHMVSCILDLTLTLEYSWGGKLITKTMTRKKNFQETNICRRMIVALLPAYNGNDHQIKKDFGQVLNSKTQVRRRHKKIMTPAKEQVQSLTGDHGKTPQKSSSCGTSEPHNSSNRAENSSSKLYSSLQRVVNADATPNGPTNRNFFEFNDEDYTIEALGPITKVRARPFPNLDQV